MSQTRSAESRYSERMGTNPALTADEYLRTSYPGLDREYRDGEVLERALPDRLHSKTQKLLISLFALLEQRLPLFGYPELRLRLRPGLIRIPDMSVFYPEEPTENVPGKPPFIAIEILSPDDRMSEVLGKLEEYRAWGVAHVWLVDPHAQRMYVCADGLHEVATLTIPELGITVQPSDIFEQA